ncbi:MAG: hypothetical protein P8177_03380 [Gemmatimonadota bacterium]
MPRLGGVAVVDALVAGIAVAEGSSDALDSLVGATRERWVGLGVAAFLMLLVGIGDDLRSLSAKWKLAAELAAGVFVVVLFPVASIDFGFFVIPPSLSWLSWGIVVLWVATVMNGYNMIDGLDGLAGGIGAIAAIALAVGAWQVGNEAAALSLVSVSGALTAFLLYNAQPARIFLGDAGSLPVGFLLAALGFIGFRTDGVWYALPAVIALSVPLLDLFTSVLRRFLVAFDVVRHDDFQERFELSMKERPGFFTADGRHIHHRLLSLGLSRRNTVLVLYTLGVVFALISLASREWPGMAPLAFVAIVALLSVIGSRWLYRELQIFRRGILLPVFETALARNRWAHAVLDFAGLAAAFIVARLLIGREWNMSIAAGQLGIRSAVVAAVGVAIFWLMGLYQISFRRAGEWVLVRSVTAVVAAICVAASLDVLLFATPLRLLSWVLTGYLAITFTMLPRLAYRVLEGFHQRGRNDGRRVAIFGAGRGGTLTLRELLQNPNAGYVPVAFIDDNPGIWRRVVEGFVVFPGGEHLSDTLSKLSVDIVAVSSLKVSPARGEELLSACADAGVELRRVRVLMEPTEEFESAERPIIELVELSAGG